MWASTSSTPPTSTAPATSESILGRWFADEPSRRDKVVLATKAVHPTGATGPTTGGLSALHIRKACEDSLRRLQTDHIDLYQFHHIDRTTPWEEIWEATERLVRDGKVVYVGSSNFAGWRPRCRAGGREGAATSSAWSREQSVYNLMERTIELEVLPAARHYGIGLLPWSPLAGGLLGRRGREATAGRRGDDSARCSATLPANSESPDNRDPACRQYEAVARPTCSTPATES